MKRLPAIQVVLDALGVSMSDPCLKAAGYDAGAFKAAGFTLSDFRAAGFDPKSLQSAGYDVLSLIANFGYDAVTSSGCDVSSIVLVTSLAPSPAKCTAQAGNRSASAGPKTLDLTPCNTLSPARWRQSLHDAAWAPS